MQEKDLPLMKNEQADCPFVSGTLICESGLYEICHKDEPRSTVILIKNTLFPDCTNCGEDVRFKLIKAAPHISEDPDFLEFIGDPEYDSQEIAAPSNAFVVQLGLDHGFRHSKEDI